MNLKVNPKRCLLLFAGIVSAFYSFSGVLGPWLPEVKNFTKEVYGASSQNWSVTQDTSGTMYFGNSSGLLEYDGSTWILHPSPGGGIIRAVAADSSGVIYSSGYMDLGYWLRDDFGMLQYTSLKEMARPFFIPNVEYWNIYLLGGKVIFRSFTQLLVYENGKMSAINFDFFVNSAALINGKLYINVSNQGIYEMRDSLQVPLFTGDFFNGKTMRFLLPHGEDKFLLGTDSHGIFLLSEGKQEAWNPYINEYFSKNQINRGCLLSTGDVLIGTILDGITLLDSGGIPKWHLNSANGMQNNTVLGLFSDREGNIWSALDHGIDYVAADRAKGIHFFSPDGLGAVYDAAFFEGRLYLGTNQGLYEGRLGDLSGPFTFVPGTQGQVWDLSVIGNHLIVGHNNGTFSVSGGKSTLISTVSGAFSLRPDPSDYGTYLQCSYSNLVKYRMEGDKLVRSGVIFNFNELIRFIEFDHLDNIWAGHMYRGIYRLRFNKARDSVNIMGYYGENSIFGKDHHLGVFKVGNRVVFTTRERLYTFDDIHDRIIPYDLLNEQIGIYAAADRIIPAGDRHYWFITPEKLGVWEISGTQLRLVKEFPAAVFDDRLIRNYENVVPFSGREVICCLENGYALLDLLPGPLPEWPVSKSPVKRAVWLQSQEGKAVPLTLKSDGYRIPWKQNSFQIRYSFPYYDTEKISYQWFLSGLSSGWNDNGHSPLLSFERLPPGMYTLWVRVADEWGNQSLSNETTLTVLFPWYWSLPARIMYLLFMITSLVAFRSLVIRSTRKKEIRKREENERELISLKNEKLQNEISFKSRELANSTMAIIKKNEFLLDLRELVLRQKNQLGVRFPDKYSNDLLRKIDFHLSSKDEWKVFETNFEQAHEAFMKNLKEEYPELTPGDMRLCAFLRMNLSSKEIAPLMGISVRGVENHRYRLRQKMKLDHNENLIETILKV